MLTAIADVMQTVLGCAQAAGFEPHREFFPAELMKKRRTMAAVASVSSQKDVAECLIGDALIKEVESVITLKLYGKVCSYTDSYELEDGASKVFEELAETDGLLSKVTKISGLKQNGSLGRLETDIELTVRTLENTEEDEDE